MNPLIILGLLIALKDIATATAALASTTPEIYIAATPLPQGYAEAMGLLDTEATTTEQEVQRLIEKYFDKEDQDKALEVARCESQLQPDAVGDKGTSYGLWQWHMPAHGKDSSFPVSKEEALDPEQSTKLAAEYWREGHRDAWSCYNRYKP